LVTPKRVSAADDRTRANATLAIRVKKEAYNGISRRRWQTETTWFNLMMNKSSVGVNNVYAVVS
jgi:hypothetical protein